MAGNGGGSVNSKIERYREAGEHEAKAKLLLDRAVSRAIHSVEKVVAKVHRTPLATVKNQLKKVVETEKLVSKTLSVSGKTWQKTARCNAAVQGRMLAQSDSQHHLVDSLQGYVAGPNEPSRASQMQDVSGGIGHDAQDDAAYMNTRPVVVGGWTL